MNTYTESTRKQDDTLIARRVDVGQSTLLRHSGDIHVHGQDGPDYFIHRDGGVSVLVREERPAPERSLADIRLAWMVEHRQGI